jgi:formylglycine-generating enzyme required for sulfatase activity/TolB-like protein
MKHISLLFGALLLATSVSAQSPNSFSVALDEAVAEIRLKVPPNATLAVPAFVINREVMAEQSAVLLSDALVTELGIKLLKNGTFKLVERQQINIDAVQDSLNFDASGLVSDESAQGIGHFIAAQYLVIGSMKMFGPEIRLYIETVKAENAQKIAATSKTISRADISSFYSANAWTPPQPASSSGRTYTTSNTGVYVGIVSFGDNTDDLTGGAPILLDANGLSKINNILDNDYKRTPRSGTLLFYGVHRALAALSANAGKYPANLDGVYLLTFTDGLDMGSNSYALSPMENQDFSSLSDLDYQAYLKGQIANRPVAGRAITAYSAGVKGNDVQDTALFTSSLSSLASGKENFYELINFGQLNSRFDAIAKNLTVTTTNTTFELRTPSFSIGTKIRMTFDGVSAAGSSSRYVEGTVAAGPNRTYVLSNIVYVGTSSSNGTQIAGVMTGTEVIYTFSNFKGYDEAVDKQVKQWNQRAGNTIWQVNSEYETGNDTTTTVEKKSAVVYIVLDASRSLSDSDVTAVRAAMKQFVLTLYQRSQGVSEPAPPVRVAQPTPPPAAPAPSPAPPPPPPSPPQAPQNLRVGAPGTDRVSLSWETVSTATSYRVYWNTQNNVTGASVLLNSLSGAVDVSGMTSGTNYYFWVSSVDKNGRESEKSAVVSVRTLAPPATAPANMVRIQGGTFTMGSPTTEVDRGSSETQHQVTVGSFYMGKYEVTQREYQALMGTNPSRFKGDNLPVENVTWYDAVNYCNALSRKEGLTPAYTVSGTNVTWYFSANGYRLPTEAEWEYACRAGTTTPFSTGSNITTNQANYDGNYPYNGNAKGVYRQKTWAVGSGVANSWGLYDMHGNVWEWCWDWYGTYPSGSQTDPMGASSGTSRVKRGGGWYSNGQNLRSAYRNYNTPSTRDKTLGFRLVRSRL